MNDKKRIAVSVNGVQKEVDCGILISDLLTGEKPCGGHGKCGKCKVIARGELSSLSDSEKKLLTSSELDNNVRLACCTYILGSCSVDSFADSAASNTVVSEGSAILISPDPMFSKYGVAIDIGTTTLAARLYDRFGTVLSEYGDLNPQSMWGADVISRIEASISGKGYDLALSIRQAIDRMILKLCSTADISVKEIDFSVITGNTVMLYLLTETSPVALSHAPFEADRLFGETLRAEDLGLTSLSADAKVYLPRCISAFVGADTVCALLATGLCDHADPVMLADIGTNGEMAIWNNKNLTVCSTAAGPAFEGVGISMGMRASSGAVDKVSCCEDKMSIHTVGETEAVGICGSGLIDAVSSLLNMEILDETGYLDDDPYTLIGRVQLTGKDIRMVQLAKSAICAGLETLLDSASLTSDKIRRLYVAGGFGKYLNPQSAKAIGLIPSALADRIDAIGNASLDGASILLLDKSSVAASEKLSKQAFVLDLSQNSVFAENYMMGMIFEER